MSKGLVEKFQSDPDQIGNEIEIAKSDLSSAKNMLGIEEWGWAHNAAYNAMLQAGRALMFSKGYRPRSQEHHTAVIEFARAVYSTKFESNVLEAFERARRRRNESLYDFAGCQSTMTANGKSNILTKSLSYQWQRSRWTKERTPS